MVIGSALSIVVLALLEEITLLVEALSRYVFNRFQKPDTGLHFCWALGLWFKFRD